MKTFKCIADIEQFRSHPLHDTIESLVTPVINEYPSYRPEDDGYLVLMEPGDVDRVLDDLDVPWRLSEGPFEGVTVVDDCFHAVYLANNQFALGFLIPDAKRIDDELPHHLGHHMELLTCRYTPTINNTQRRFVLSLQGAL
jgi:hypothetical protein